MSDELDDKAARDAGHDRSNPSGLPEDHPLRVAARKRAETFKEGDVPEHHSEPEPFPGIELES